MTDKMMADTLSAEAIQTETAYPTDLEAIHLGPTGEVIEITFKNGRPPLTDFAGGPLRNVDLIRMYVLPVSYLLLLRDGRHKYAYKMPSCKGVGADLDVGVSGNSSIEFNANGTIRKITYPNGDFRDSITDDLMVREITGVDVVAFRTYTLLEYRDRGTKQVLYRVL